MALKVQRVSRARAPGAAAAPRPCRAIVARAAAVVASSAGVKTVQAAEAGQLVKDGWRVLDVRPPGEVDKVWIEGAVAVPAYLPETRSDPGALIKRFATWSNGGWWVGATHMNPNPDFAAEVQRRVPKDAKVLAVCQTGIRSLAAAERLAALGYGDLAWLDGGLDEAKAGDLPTRPEGKDPRLAGIGGLSEMLGWTKPQQENGQSAFFGGVNTVLAVVAVILVLDLVSIPLGKMINLP